MRRAGGLWPAVTSFSNLVQATARAARGNRDSAGTARFLLDREPRLLALQRALLDRSWRPARCHRFVIHDPKRRTITAVPFADRVVHHALIAPLEPVFERRMVATSYACRRGKGAHRAIAHARRLVRRHRFALKLDIAAFFPSLSHAVVIHTLRRLVKDGPVLDLCRTVVAGPEDGTEDGAPTGLPIGSLCSQWFANLVLDRLDHHIAGRLRPAGYVRYMDDFVVFGADKRALWTMHDAIATFLGDELKLGLKARATRLLPTAAGLPFLGFVLYPGITRVQPASLRRYRWRLRFLRWRFESGELDAERYRAAVAAVRHHSRPRAAPGSCSNGARRSTWNCDLLGRAGSSSGKRVLRGGSWNDNARRCRSAYRNARHPGNRNDNAGFRPASSS